MSSIKTVSLIAILVVTLTSVLLVVISGRSDDVETTKRDTQVEAEQTTEI